MIDSITQLRPALEAYRCFFDSFYLSEWFDE